MKIIFWGKARRSVNCLNTIHAAGIKVDLVVAQSKGSAEWIGDTAEELNLPYSIVDEPNSLEVQKKLKSYSPDIFVLAGYGKILKQPIIDIPKIMTVNLHGGKLPEYRGSSPLNWVLINGERSFGLTIIKVDKGVDTGDILLSREFVINSNATIQDLHDIADSEFPKMLLGVLSQIKQGAYKLQVQNESKARYYPLRFPDDGLVWFDTITAKKLHNLIRALTSPYPCAFFYWKSRKVKILSSELPQTDFFGEPGRVYRKSKKGLLVGTQRKAIWIKNLEYEDTGELFLSDVNKYDKLPTLRETVLNANMAKC